MESDYKQVFIRIACIHLWIPGPPSFIQKIYIAPPQKSTQRCFLHGEKDQFKQLIAQ